MFSYFVTREYRNIKIYQFLYASSRLEIPVLIHAVTNMPQGQACHDSFTPLPLPPSHPPPSLVPHPGAQLRPNKYLVTAHQ